MPILDLIQQQKKRANLLVRPFKGSILNVYIICVSFALTLIALKRLNICFSPFIFELRQLRQQIQVLSLRTKRQELQDTQIFFIFLANPLKISRFRNKHDGPVLPAFRVKQAHFSSLTTCEYFCTFFQKSVKTVSFPRSKNLFLL